MFYFNEQKYDFWEIYRCILQYYPVGIFRESQSFINSFVGMEEQKKVITDNICDEGVFKDRYMLFLKEMGDEMEKNVIGETSVNYPCYSGRVELERSSIGDLTRVKELLFFICLLGPFYSILGVDRCEINMGKTTFATTNFLVVSPEGIYAPAFSKIEASIEQKFKNYRFVPFFICRQEIEGLFVYGGLNTGSIFHALFNDRINVFNRTLGDLAYKSNQWSRLRTDEMVESKKY
jgi:hypothetical protein